MKSYLHQDIYDAVREKLDDLRRPLKDYQEKAIVAAVAVAIRDSILFRKIFPFKTKRAAEGGGEYQVFECLAPLNRYGYLRQVRRTVKQKGKRAKVHIHYVDSRGNVLPSNVAEDTLF